MNGPLELAAQPFAESPAGYVILGVLVLLIASMGSFVVYIVRHNATTDTALALLIQDVRPAGEQSLRTIVQNIAVEVSSIAGQPGNHPPEPHRRW